MRRSRTFFLLGSFCFSLSLAAQLKLPVNTGIRSDLQKIVSEYPAQFAGIRGEVVERNPQSTEYRSRIGLGSAGHCSIVAYSSGSQPVYSWQGMLFESEDFEAAAKKYKWLYGQLKGANVYYLKDQYTLRGAYQEADESLGFAVSSLYVADAPAPYKKLRVDVSLQFEFPEWKVQLLVYEKEREDDEQGSEDEG